MRGEALLQQQNSPALPKMNLLVPATPGCAHRDRSHPGRRPRPGNEGDALALEQLEQADEVDQAAGQAIDLVDHHDVDLAGLDIGQQLLHGGAIGV